MTFELLLVHSLNLDNRICFKLESKKTSHCDNYVHFQYLLTSTTVPTVSSCTTCMCIYWKQHILTMFYIANTFSEAEMFLQGF